MPLYEVKHKSGWRGTVRAKTAELARGKMAWNKRMEEKDFRVGVLVKERKKKAKPNPFGVSNFKGYGFRY